MQTKNLHGRNHHHNDKDNRNDKHNLQTFFHDSADSRGNLEGRTAHLISKIRSRCENGARARSSGISWKCWRDTDASVSSLSCLSNRSRNMRTWARALVTLRAFDVLCIDVLDVYRKTHSHARPTRFHTQKLLGRHSSGTIRAAVKSSCNSNSCSQPKCHDSRSRNY